MKYTNLVGLLAVPLMVITLGLPARAADSGSPVTCKDGTTSTATGRGACSGHGGVQKASKSKAEAGAPAAAPAAPAASGTSVTCKDGTTSTAAGRGACSGHGGVQKASKSKHEAEAAAASPAAAPPAAAATTAAKSSVASKSAPVESAGSTDPTGATAKCKDGTYSKAKHHSGACSSHGGVAEWLAK